MNVALATLTMVLGVSARGNDAVEASIRFVGTVAAESALDVSVIETIDGVAMIEASAWSNAHGLEFSETHRYAAVDGDSVVIATEGRLSASADGVELIALDVLERQRIARALDGD